MPDPPELDDVAQKAVELMQIKYRAKTLEAQCSCGRSASGVLAIERDFGWRFFKRRNYYRPQAKCRECHREQKRQHRLRQKQLKEAQTAAPDPAPDGAGAVGAGDAGGAQARPGRRPRTKAPDGPVSARP